MNAARVTEENRTAIDHLEKLLGLALSSSQGLTVSLHTVGRRTATDKKEHLIGELLSVNFIERGRMYMLSFEVRHPGSQSGGIRKHYQAADEQTMKNLRAWVENTSVADLKRIIKKGEEIRPGLTFDRPHG